MVLKLYLRANIAEAVSFRLKRFFYELLLLRGQLAITEFE
jgi:hypothetical protein